MAVRPDKFRMLTFDCYGTLIDWEQGILAALRPWIGRQDRIAADEEILQAFAGVENTCQTKHPLSPYPDILRMVHQRIAVVLGMESDRDGQEALATSVRDWPPFKDSPTALQALGRHRKLVILSNIDRSSFAYSNALLQVEFDAIITAEDVGTYKPQRGHFEKALELADQWGVARDEILHVAQSLFHDHVPAKELGLATAWIDRRSGKSGTGATPEAPSPVEPDVTFRSLAALVGWFESEEER